MLFRKQFPIAEALFAATLISGLSFADSGPMECTNNECTIDYSDSRPLNLTLPKDVKKVSFSYNGSGRVKVKTQEPDTVIDKLVINCVGSARVDLAGVKAKEIKVKYRGSGDLDIFGKDKVVIQNSGSGDINVSGTAKVEVTGHGSGKVGHEN